MTASVDGNNVLNVSLDAANDHAYITNSGSGIRVGTTANGEQALADTTGIVAISVSGTGLAGQNVDFDGATYTLTGFGGSALTTAGLAVVDLGADITTDGNNVTIASSSHLNISANVTIDTETGNDSSAGDVDLSGATVIQSSGAPDLTIDASTTSGVGGNISLVPANVDNQWLNDQLYDSRGSGADGIITVTGNMEGDNNGGDLASLTMRGDVRLTANSALNLGDSTAGVEGVDLTQATISATIAGVNLSIVTTSSHASDSSGNIQLGEFDSTGGSFVNNLTLNSNGSSSGADGTITLTQPVQIGGVLTSDSGTSNTSIQGDLTVGGGASQVIAAQIASANVTLTVGGGGTLTANGVVTGNNGLTKAGPGALALVSANTFSGHTVISEGTVQLSSGTGSNNIPATTPIEVQTGTTLDVTGLVGGTLVLVGGQTLQGGGAVAGGVVVSSGATISPGASPGVLTTGNLTIAAGGAFNAEINGPNAGSDYDQLIVQGAVDITNATLNLSGTAAGITANDPLMLIDNDGADAVTGTFAGFAEGAAVSFGPFNGVITYQGGDGNDVVLLPTGDVTYDATAGDDSLWLRVDNNGGVPRLELLAGVTIDVAGGVISVSGGSIVNSRLLASVTSYTINGLAGVDRLAIDYGYAADSGDDLAGLDLKFNGGDPVASPGDALFVKEGVFGKTEYAYSTTDSGFIRNYSDDAGTSLQSTITYTGLEPITNTGTVTNIEFILPASADTQAILEDDGTSGNSLSRLRSNPVAFEQTDFANPTGSLTITRGSATDDLTVNAVPDFDRDLTVGSGGGPFDQVAVSGVVTLGANENFTIDASSINFPNASSSVSLSGLGAATLTAANGIRLATGASLATVDGAVSLTANAAASAAGVFDGIVIDGAMIQSMTGDISLTGNGGGAGGIGIGIFLSGKVQSDSGAISLLGGSVDSVGIRVSGAGSEVRSVGVGAVPISVTLQGSGAERGVLIFSGGGVYSTGTGVNAADIVILGQGTGSNSRGISLGNIVGPGVVSSVDGDIRLTGQSISQGVFLGFGSEVRTDGGGIGIVASSSGGAGSAGMALTGAMTQIVSTSGDIEIQVSGASGPGLAMEDGTTISTTSGDVDIQSASGDILLGGVSGVNVVINAAAGSILDNGDTDVDVVSTTLVLTASGDVGQAAAVGQGAIETQTTNLEGASGGGFHLDNDGPLTIGGVGPANGVSAGGAIELFSDDLNVTESLASTGGGNIDLYSNNATRTFAIGSGPEVKGSGITTANAAYGLDDAEIDLISTSGKLQVHGDASSDQFNLNYQGASTLAIGLFGEDGEDTFFVKPSPAAAIHIDGGTPSAPASPGDTLHLDIADVDPPIVIDTVGGYAVWQGAGPLTFVEIETLDLCDSSGPVDVNIGDLYVRSTDEQERIEFSQWPDGGVRLRIFIYPTRTDLRYPQHFGLVNGQQMLTRIVTYAGGGDDYVQMLGNIVDACGMSIPAEFHGETGNDILLGGPGGDELIGGPGNDRLNGYEGDNTMYGDGDVLDNNGIPVEQETDGGDRVEGRSGSDVIFGGGGKDYLYGGAGDDYVHAGSGDDFADGGLGDDVVIGADGNDQLRGYFGNDILLGGAGIDAMYGSDGQDVLLGGDGRDQVRGDAGDDLVVGGNAASINDNTTDAALRAILSDWVNDPASTPAGLGALLTDGEDDLLIGSGGADAFHDGDEDRIYDLLAGDRVL